MLIFDADQAVLSPAPSTAPSTVPSTPLSSPQSASARAPSMNSLARPPATPSAPAIPPPVRPPAEIPNPTSQQQQQEQLLARALAAEPRRSAALTGLLTLPVVRYLDVRRADPDRPLKLGRVPNLEAAIGYRCGTLAAKECTHCSHSYGQFPSCVRVPGFFGGSCSNCHLNSEGARCSFRAGMVLPASFPF